jgi:hypothetical protein
MLGVPEKANGLLNRQAILFDFIRFRFREPNRRPKSFRETIPLCRKQARMLHRRKRCLRRFPIVPDDDAAVV